MGLDSPELIIPACTGSHSDGKSNLLHRLLAQASPMIPVVDNGCLGFNTFERQRPIFSLCRPNKLHGPGGVREPELCLLETGLDVERFMPSSTAQVHLTTSSLETEIMQGERLEGLGSFFQTESTGLHCGCIKWPRHLDRVLSSASLPRLVRVVTVAYPYTSLSRSRCCCSASTTTSVPLHQTNIYTIQS
jgi:hypothetical protein